MGPFAGFADASRKALYVIIGRSDADITADSEMLMATAATHKSDFLSEVPPQREAAVHKLLPIFTSMLENLGAELEEEDILRELRHLCHNHLYLRKGTTDEAWASRCRRFRDAATKKARQMEREVGLFRIVTPSSSIMILSVAITCAT